MKLILGGTHGLGWEVVQLLQSRGEDTYTVGRSHRAATHGSGMAADLSIGQDTRKLVDFIENTPVMSGFYWLAAYGYMGDFADQPNPHKMAEINFAGVMPIAQAVWRKMLSLDTVGEFVVVSSITGLKPRKDEAVYAATKHAQVGFARSLGLESERLGTHIKVALFLPGGMQTPFWEGHEPANISEFLDPAKVALKICEAVKKQRAIYFEETIERGSL